MAKRSLTLSFPNHYLLDTPDFCWPEAEVKEAPKPRFPCKSCDRWFHSFHALGGHRSAHNNNSCGKKRMNAKKKQRKKLAHICEVCGLVFPLGQALGGHMRMHTRKNHKKIVSCDESGGVCLELKLSPPQS